MKIGIVGTGAYAIALASLLENTSHSITMWTKLENEYKELISNHTNLKVLDYKLNNKIKFTMSLEDLMKNDIIIVAIPAKFLKDTLDELKLYYKNQEILIATKGMIQNPISLLDEYFKKNLNTDKISFIAGPSFAHDVIKKHPIGLTLASDNLNSLNYFKNLFNGISYLTIDVTNDIKGIQICSILKNIIAIGSGILAGMDINNSTRIKYLIDCKDEIINLIKKLNGNSNTFMTYAGLGDYFLTTMSNNSRNYTFGYLIGKNENFHEYILNNTIEGLDNLTILYEYLKNKKITSNIINILYEIIFLNKDKLIILKYLENKK